MDVRSVIFVLFFGLAACSESSEELTLEDTPKHLSGEKFYQQRCDVCHGPDGKLGVSDAKDLSKSTITDKQIKNYINKGQGAMPPFEHAIEADSTLIELIEYVKLLRE